MDQKSLIHGRSLYSSPYEQLHLMAQRYLEMTKKRSRINRRGQSSARYIMFEMIRSMLKSKARIDNHIVGYYYKLKRDHTLNRIWLP
jgi:hypothetical protein